MGSFIFSASFASARFLRLGLGVLALGALALPAAQAQVTRYDTRSGFGSATTGLTSFNFDGYAPKNLSSTYPTGLTIQGVTFTSKNNLMFVLDPGFAGPLTIGATVVQGPFGDPFNGHPYIVSDQAGLMSVSLPAGTTAFGTDLTSFSDNAGGVITVTVNGQAFNFVTPGSRGSVFAGFTSATPIISLTLQGGKGPAQDNISFGQAQAAPVPEASTLLSLSLLLSFSLLLALGSAGVVSGRRKRACAAC